MVQNKMISGDIVSVLDSAVENLSEGEASNSDDEVGDKNLITKVAYQAVSKVMGKWLK
jgi:hypothetical protein